MRPAVLGLTLVTLFQGAAYADAWPRFRGPNGSGAAMGEEPLPADIEPGKHVLWKTPLPTGHSSPVVVSDHIYLTGVSDGEAKLLTICLDKATGKVLWEAPAPFSELENINLLIGSYAQSSCAANEDRVVSFFGSAGMFCYDRAGKLLWHKKFGRFKNEYGAGSSPILVDDRIILNQDHDMDSFLTAIRLSDGSTLWKTERPQFRSGFATPLIWTNQGQSQVVVPGTVMVTGYDLQSGEAAWMVRGISWGVVTSPVVGSHGLLFVSAWSPGSGDVLEYPTFRQVLDMDVNQNGRIDRRELDEITPLAGYFSFIDRNKDGIISSEEYESIRSAWLESRNVCLAIRPGGSGDITDTHVLWSSRVLLPYVASPLYHDGYLFTVKNGGIVNCLEAATGEEQKQGRISATGDHYCSPVVGDGKIYFVSERGKLSVITAAPRWKEIASAEFGEDVYATPALVDGRIYLRTLGHLYCFGYENLENENERRASARKSRWLLVVLGLCGSALAILFAGRVVFAYARGSKR